MEPDRVESRCGLQVLCPPCGSTIPESPVLHEDAVAAAVAAGWQKAPGSGSFQTYVCPECYQQLYAE